MDAATQSTVIIIAAIGSQLLLLIGAFFTGWTALTAKRIAIDTKAETIQQTTKIDAVVKDTAVVLGHVNSEKTAAEGRENTLKRENQLLREMLAERQLTASLLAQATAGRTRSADVLSGSAPVQVEVIKQPEPPRADAAGPLEVLVVQQPTPPRPDADGPLEVIVKEPSP